MIARVRSATLVGIDAFRVDVETQIFGSLKRFSIVGLPDGAVRESRERVRCAIENSGFIFPTSEVIVSLAPASLPKEGAGFDLAIALSVLAADRQLDAERLSQLLVLGELALDGKLKGIQGALAAAILVRSTPNVDLLVPAENGAQAAAIDGVQVFGVRSLQEAALFVSGASELKSILPLETDTESTNDHELPSLGDVVGQYAPKRALEIAGAGGHNLLMLGPPGAGKSMLARCLPSILPPLSREEAIQVTQIHSALDSCHQNGRSAENRSAGSTLLRSRPFRAPHQSISAAGLVGGGTRPVPGEISFAHRGVLFLDEFVEFRRDVIECLRQPLENREVALMRAQFRLVFPADFILLAAMNPCPCGMKGVAGRQCSCSPGIIRRYLAKVSGPILDRIDLQVWVPAVPISELNKKLGTDPTAEICDRIRRARLQQRDRLQREGGLNAAMRPREIRTTCVVDSLGKRFLETAAEKLRLSARGYSRVLKVARTIADLDESLSIGVPHLSEAISYRLPGEFG